MKSILHHRVFSIPWFRFMLVGGTCTALNIVFLWWAVERLQLSYLFACTIAFFLINLAGYILNKSITFSQGRKIQLSQLLRYYIVMILSLCLNLLLMLILVEWLGMHYLVASISVSFILAALNYLAHAGFTFFRKNAEIK
ncbi:MAG: GtrA family protein [Burkholderiales bacterium]|nr:GtrA family protein [Burkholderiales bacterium]